MTVSIFVKILRLAVLFVRNAVGCFFAPYITYRHIATSEKKDDAYQTVFILILTLCYFAFASLVRVGWRNPFILTLKFNSLFLAAAGGFVGIMLFLYLLGKVWGGAGKLCHLVTLWAYTLLPTVIWFFLTSILYILLPPPRTLSIWGKLYSVIFIAVSVGLLFWKMILYYLTLRFGLRLDLFRIVVSTVMIAPIIAVYSILMYRMGIFRIPFI